MKWFKSKLLSILVSITLLASISYALAPMEMFSHPDSTTSVEVVDRKLMSVDSGWLHAIMANNVEGHIYKKLNAHSHSVGTADQELSALGTAGFGNWSAAAAGAVIVSTSAQDASGGTGATLIIVRGLDDVAGEWVAATTTITPTGTTPTGASAQTFIRVDEIEVVTAGTGLTNDGDITLSISGTNIIKMYADHSTSETGRFTIPSGYKGHFQNPEASAIGNKEMTYHIFCRDNTVANSPFLLRASWHSKDGGFRPNGLLDIFTEKVDIVFVAHSELAGAKASASIEGWIEVMP